MNHPNPYEAHRGKRDADGLLTEGACFCAAHDWAATKKRAYGTVEAGGVSWRADQILVWFTNDWTARVERETGKVRDLMAPIRV